ncbi:MAG: TetR/AcrR family transcriptional regulator [Leptolinea sp.]|nr:TetR/AcrR family transcriptional regulator [Leptolinea sp.]
MVRELSLAKRDLFLQTALRMFAEKGIQNTSTADIASKAGTAAGTLFLYFHTKQDLINEVALQISRDEAEYVIDRLDQTMTAREMLEVIWSESIRCCSLIRMHLPSPGTPVSRVFCRRLSSSKRANFSRFTMRQSRRDWPRVA